MSAVPDPTDRRVTRLLHLLARLDTAPGHWSRAALAADYAVSERQITKDLAILERGLLITIRRTGAGYALDRALGLPDPDGPAARTPVRRDRGARHAPPKKMGGRRAAAAEDTDGD